MRIDSYYHSIENYFGELCLVVTAYNKRLDQYFDFFRVYESGKKECRNLYSSCFGCYSITYPGAYARSYYGERADNHYIVEDWGECAINHVGYERGNLNHIGDINLILKKYPDFVYTLKKWRGELYYMTGTLPVIFEALQVWKEHPEAEYLFALHCDNIAFSKTFWKLSEKKRREISKWILQHKTNASGYTLRQIQNIIKYKMTMDEFRDYENFKSKCYTAVMSVDCFRYMKKKGLVGHDNYKLYMDYRKLSKIAGHNLKEEYWNHPADLEKAHAKVLAEVNAIEAVKEAQKLIQLRIDNPGIFHNLDVISKHLSVFNTTIDGYEIIVTSDLNEWQRQADTLHQCIISCAYYKRVAKREEILVFIRKAGLPIATAEILPQNRIGQFYADEHSRRPEVSRPSPKVKSIFNAWLSDKPDLLEYSKAKLKKTKLAEVV